MYIYYMELKIAYILLYPTISKKFMTVYNYMKVLYTYNKKSNDIYSILL